jgi:hypothetical protein
MLRKITVLTCEYENQLKKLKQGKNIFKKGTFQHGINEPSTCTHLFTDFITFMHNEQGVPDSSCLTFTTTSTFPLTFEWGYTLKLSSCIRLLNAAFTSRSKMAPHIKNCI